jgi:hypothetical protein
MAKPRRHAKRAVLLFAEGATEEAFLRFLGGLIYERGCGHSLKIASANGGSPEDIIEACLSRLELAAYDTCLVLMDTDVPWSENVFQAARDRGLILVGAEPCIEGLLLRLLDDPYYPKVKADSKKCKVRFEEAYLDERQKLNPNAYARIITKEALISKRRQCTALYAILRFIEDGRA